MAHPTEPTDPTERLLARIAVGDREALKTVYELHAPRLLGVLMQIVGNRADAEDLLQAAFIAIWERAHMYDPRLGKATSWLVVIARNKAIDLLRKRTRRSQMLEERLADMPQSFTTLPDGINTPGGILDVQLLRETLSSLPAEQRESLELAFIRGYSHSEIAESTGTPLGTVKARIRRGLERMQNLLDGKEWM